jgi:hypothetical protein
MGREVLKPVKPRPRFELGVSSLPRTRFTAPLSGRDTGHIVRILAPFGLSSYNSINAIYKKHPVRGAYAEPISLYFSNC